MKYSSLCPRCGCTQTSRSRRKPWEYALWFLRPYRCVDCQHRFFAFQPLGG